MKKVLATLGQLILLVLFGLLFFSPTVGFIYLFVFHRMPPVMPHWFVQHPTPTTERYFNPLGLYWMTGLFLIVLVIEAAARRFRAAGWTTLAYAAALLIGIVEKYGWVSRDLF